LEFTNEKIVLTLPHECLGIDGIQDIDPNDRRWTRSNRDWIWIKYIWETTHSNYKKVLKNWYKSTGGSSGESSMFEGWSNEKLDAYNVDVDTYDHTEIS